MQKTTDSKKVDLQWEYEAAGFQFLIGIGLIALSAVCFLLAIRKVCITTYIAGRKYIETISQEKAVSK